MSQKTRANNIKILGGLILLLAKTVIYITVRISNISQGS